MVGIGGDRARAAGIMCRIGTPASADRVPAKSAQGRRPARWDGVLVELACFAAAVRVHHRSALRDGNMYGALTHGYNTVYTTCGHSPHLRRSPQGWSQGLCNWSVSVCLPRRRYCWSRYSVSLISIELQKLHMMFFRPLWPSSNYRNLVESLTPCTIEPQR
jgi:hypothetical protein